MTRATGPLVTWPVLAAVPRRAGASEVEGGWGATRRTGQAACKATVLGPQLLVGSTSDLMANIPLARAVLPAEVSKALLTRAQSTFAADYRDTLLLLVRAEPGGDLVAGLDASRGASAQPAFLPARQLGYDTQAHDPRVVSALLAASAKPRPNQAELVAAALAQSVHFVLSLRKRPDADQILLDRISVGRALNKDIVLRDASVSKLHAWFELHEALDFSVTDAGSKNQTYVNGEPLVPRQPFPLSPGDAIRFGSVSTLLCEAEALWSAIHEPAAG